MKSPSKVALAGGGPEVEANLTRRGILALHRPVDGGKGFVLTHVATGRAVLRARLRRDAIEARRALEALDWSDPSTIRTKIEEIRRSV